MAKKFKRYVPGTRYLSVRMGQLNVADIREVSPGDFLKHRCRIGVHLSPMQAPELAPLLIRQDTFFVENRINWDYWDNYISQKLLDNSAAGPFSATQLLPPQICVMMGNGFDNSSHIDNVRGIYDLLEQLGARFSYTDKTQYIGTFARYTGSCHMFNAFPLLGYWRIWHDFYRDPFLQNDEFEAYSATQGGLTSLGRQPDFGDPFADESPVSDSNSTAAYNWNSPLSSLNSNFVGQSGANLPGYAVPLNSASYGIHQRYKGIFSFAKRQPAMAVGIYGYSSGSTLATDTVQVLPGCVAILPIDRGVPTTNGVLPPAGSLGMCAPVCMPKDYIFTARQSPVYNMDIATPDSLTGVRKAFQVLGYREKVNRFDNRIKAWLYNMFHVNVSDKRLDSPFWLHGAQSIINTQEVLGTVNNTDTVLGQLGGFGIGAIQGKFCKMRAENHGFLYTLFYIVPTPVYGDGVRRYWWRGALKPYSRDFEFDGPMDYPLPDFARIGQQGIFRGEISYIGDRGTSSSGVAINGTFSRGTFGYGDRYSDMGFSNADVCGDFRTTLKFWHTGLFYGDNDQLSSVAGDLNLVNGVNGDFVSMFVRRMNGVRGTGNQRPTIQSTLSYRLFDAGVTADQFWCVVSTDYYVSSRINTHPQPGHADHTSKVV